MNILCRTNQFIVFFISCIHGSLTKCEVKISGCRIFAKLFFAGSRLFLVHNHIEKRRSQSNHFYRTSLVIKNVLYGAKNTTFPVGDSGQTPTVKPPPTCISTGDRFENESAAIFFKLARRKYLFRWAGFSSLSKAMSWLYLVGWWYDGWIITLLTLMSCSDPTVCTRLWAPSLRKQINNYNKNDFCGDIHVTFPST